MRRIYLVSLLSLAAGCSQPVAGPAPGPAGTASPSVAAASAPASPASSTDERDWSVPKEKFVDPQRNFEATKKALLEQYYSDSFTEEDLYRAAVAGMLERVDPAMHKWNRLLSPSDVADLRHDLMGEVVGVGIKIGFDPASGYIDVKGTIPNTPAERAGLAPPDKIVTVDGKLYKGLTLRDVVGDIRGKAGETVTLSVLRGDKLVSIPLVREKVNYDLLRQFVLGGNVGYVRIPSFNAKTPAALHDALSDLAGKHVRSLVLDLRANAGGSFDDSVEAAGEMVPAGSTIASLAKRGKTEPVRAKSTPLLVDVPMAVVVDHDTASSAELVTAALRDLRHASVVGSQTQGKWTVQRLDDLSNGYAIKFTVAQFQSPQGKSYEGTGLPVDIEVDAPAEAVAKCESITDPAKRLEEDTQLRTAVAVLARGQ